MFILSPKYVLASILTGIMATSDISTIVLPQANTVDYCTIPGGSGNPVCFGFNVTSTSLTCFPVEPIALNMVVLVNLTTPNIACNVFISPGCAGGQTLAMNSGVNSLDPPFRDSVTSLACLLSKPPAPLTAFDVEYCTEDQNCFQFNATASLTCIAVDPSAVSQGVKLVDVVTPGIQCFPFTDSLCSSSSILLNSGVNDLVPPFQDSTSAIACQLPMPTPPFFDVQYCTGSGTCYQFNVTTTTRTCTLLNPLTLSENTNSITVASPTVQCVAYITSNCNQNAIDGWPLNQGENILPSLFRDNTHAIACNIILQSS